MSWRKRTIARIEERLSRTESPRLQMFVLVATTGAVGFVASSLLLRLGLDSIWLRWSLGVVAAYGAFLSLVGLWVLYHRVRARLRDAPPEADPEAHFFGEEVPDEEVSDESFMAPPGAAPERGERQHAGPAKSKRGNLDVDFPDISLGDEALPLVLVLVALVAVLGTAGYLVFTAPTLLAELLVDGVLSAALYRRLHRVHEENWLATAVRRTIVPAVITLVLVMATGGGLSRYAPEATTLGGVMKHRAEKRAERALEERQRRLRATSGTAGKGLE
jgi:hypothetical protein